jgi:TonB family protein
MRVVILVAVVGSLLCADMEQTVVGRVHLSETVGDSLVNHRIQPICPYKPCTRCDDAKVLLKLVVKKSGTVKQVIVAHSSDSTLAGAALDAVRQWRYDRYVLNGSPVEYDMHVTIRSWECGT